VGRTRVVRRLGRASVRDVDPKDGIPSCPGGDHIRVRRQAKESNPAGYLAEKLAEDDRPLLHRKLDDADTFLDSTPGQEANAGGAGVLHPGHLRKGSDDVSDAVDRDDRDWGSPKLAASAPSDRQEVLRTDLQAKAQEEDVQSDDPQ